MKYGCKFSYICAYQFPFININKWVWIKFSFNGTIEKRPTLKILFRDDMLNQLSGLTMWHLVRQLKRKKDITIKIVLTTGNEHFFQSYPWCNAHWKKIFYDNIIRILLDIEGKKE